MGLLFVICAGIPNQNPKLELATYLGTFPCRTGTCRQMCFYLYRYRSWSLAHNTTKVPCRYVSRTTSSASPRSCSQPNHTYTLFVPNQECVAKESVRIINWESSRTSWTPQNRLSVFHIGYHVIIHYCLKPATYNSTQQDSRCVGYHLFNLNLFCIAISQKVTSLVIGKVHLESEILQHNCCQFWVF